MKAHLIAMMLLAVGSLGKALKKEKRYIVTSVILETATVTIIGSPKSESEEARSTSRPTATGTTSILDLNASTVSNAVEPSNSADTTASTDSVAQASPSTPSPSSVPPPPDQTSNESVSEYADPILKEHNLHRDNHTVAHLRWDTHLADIAQQIASTCVYGHDISAGGVGYGQNIGAGAPGEQVNAMITNQMYNDEMMHYPVYGTEPDMSNFELWGHFSQIVWKNTEKIGCYTQHCPGGLANTGSSVSPYFTVCNYSPAGNSGGEYAANVIQPQGQPFVGI